MLLYSKTTISFIQKIKARSRAIMAQEMGLIYKTKRFEYKGFTYPLHFVVFEDPSKLGYFDSSQYQIGLNKDLMLNAKDDVIDNILRHELAHLFTYLEQPESFIHLKPHGHEFQNVCRRFKWGQEISRAKSSLELDNKQSSSSHEVERHLGRLKKLLSLASSSNPHEAQAATIKANELLLKYNLSQVKDLNQDDEIACVKKVLFKKRTNTKLSAIYEILQHFYVKPVLSKQKNGTHLEVVGTRHNVELADYVAKFLDYEFDYYWKQAQKQDNKLKGLVAKNNYMLGLAKGFIDKLDQEKACQDSSRHELMVIDRQLERLSKYAYPTLRHIRHTGPTHCQKALDQGKRDGQKLTLRSALKSGKQIFLLE